MALTTATAGALVRGAPSTRKEGPAMAQRKKPKKVKVILTRGIYHLGVQCPKGTILEVEERLAAWLLAVNKAKSYEGKKKARNIALELEAGDAKRATERAEPLADDDEVKRIEQEAAAEAKLREAKKKKAAEDRRRAIEGAIDGGAAGPS